MTETAEIAALRADSQAVISATLGRRLGALRHDRNLSFDALAARSGVSKGLLVQIEQGQGNPSIATLCKLAAALRVAVVDFIAEAEHSRSLVHVVAPGAMAALWKGPAGGCATLLVGSEGPEMFELWDWTLMPGERFESKGHPRGTLELIHVKAGRLRLEVADSSHILVRGTSAYAHTEYPHAYVCTGKRQVRFTMAVLERPPSS